MISIRIYCANCQENYQYTKNEELAFSVKCEKCGNILLESSPINGYLYILSNPSMPNLLKIGFTTRTVDERVAELNASTGVPDKFIVEAYFCSSTPENDERFLHAELNDYRKNENREFFQIPIFDAIGKIENILKKPPDLLGKNGQVELQRQVELRRQEEELERQEALKRPVENRCPVCNGYAIPYDLNTQYKKCTKCGSIKLRSRW
jgi:ribosomal protein S27E